MVITPKKHLLARKNVVWAIKRENRSNGSPGRVPEKKGQDRTVKKVTKALYFKCKWNPHWTDFYRNLHSSCRSRRHHVYKLLNWNFQGLRFYRGRISHFPIDSCVSLTTVQRYTIRAVQYFAVSNDVNNLNNKLSAFVISLHRLLEYNTCTKWARTLDFINKLHWIGASCITTLCLKNVSTFKLCNFVKS